MVSVAQTLKTIKEQGKDQSFSFGREITNATTTKNVSWV
jgi:hypothetical protein